MKLMIGADPFPPYQYYDEAGMLVGSDYEVIDAALKNMGVTPEYVIDDWNAVEEKLLKKEIDAAFQVQETPERVEKYHFSDLLRNAVTTLVTLDHSIDSIDEIISKDLKIAVIGVYSYGDIIDTLPEQVKVKCHNQMEQVKAVLSKKADLAVVDLGVFEYQIKDIKDTNAANLKVLRHLDFKRPLHVVFNDPDLRDKFNKELKTIKKQS